MQREIEKYGQLFIVCKRARVTTISMLLPGVLEYHTYILVVSYTSALHMPGTYSNL